MSTKIQVPASFRYLTTFLRIIIGWHFLYEGLVKLLDPNWSSGWYLINAQGYFAGFFHAMASNATVLNIIDILNVWGLILIGLGLMLGIMTRIASISGVVLIGLYYFSNPPFIGYDPGTNVEGHYLFVNKNLVELAALLVFVMLPAKLQFGLDNLFTMVDFSFKSPVKAVPREVNHETLPENKIYRRELVKQMIAIPFLGGFVYAVARNYGWGSHEEAHLSQSMKVNAVSGATAMISRELDLTQLKKKIPSGMLGDHQIGRVICGGNLISGFAHSRDLIYVSTFLKKYFTEQKVMETFRLCEAAGMNTCALRVAPEEINILNRYRKNGGKIQWIAPAYPEEDDYKTNIDLAIDNGAIAVMVMGNVGDQWVREGKLDLLDKTIHHIKSRGVYAGLVGHQLETIRIAEEAGIPTDFYMKTLHHRDYWSYRPEEPKTVPIIDNYAIDNYWAMTPETTIQYMESVNKPWIAFKTLAAGALKPEEGLRYVFENGADFVCLGMFDFQVIEDANIVNDILDQPISRRREWMA
ncbi:MAG: DoxX family membrane protein [Cyclobacteriaceae bacterium]|nr:DoxX family membrane protein [Cyclobacteriaceae bacterium]